MSAAAQQQTTFGEHPLTSDLVGTLHNSDQGLLFTPADIERFCTRGSRLPPLTLLAWLRDLSILVITLRNDMSAPVAATQIERGLVDPLTAVLDDYVVGRSIAETRARNAKATSDAERKKLGDNRILLPKSTSSGITMIRPKGKRSNS